MVKAVHILFSGVRVVCLILLICALLVALTGFSGSPQTPNQSQEPQTVGKVTNLAASTDGQAASVRLTWDPADNGQVYFVAYLKTAELDAKNYASTQVATFTETESMIGDLEAGTPYSYRKTN